jgi:hypothetical protein
MTEATSFEAYARARCIALSAELDATSDWDTVPWLKKAGTVTITMTASPTSPLPKLGADYPSPHSSTSSTELTV